MRHSLVLVVLMFMLAATVFTGALVVAVVATPALYDQGMVMIPAAAAIGLALAVPVAWLVARTIRNGSQAG